uniref:InlB B-repeat-containing protein n=1 Tax=Adlercreutzia sp. ZJ154 TaxID=2709790 RepID=UPI0013EAE258
SKWIQAVRPGTSNFYDIYAPSVDGYTFDGFYLDKDFTIPAVKSDYTHESTSNIFNPNYSKDIYIKWTSRQYTITYKGYDGAELTGQRTSYKAGDEDFVLVNPTKLGYKYTGWNVTVVGQGSVLIDQSGDNTTIKTGTWGNLECTAIVAPINYTLHFADGASGVFNSTSWPADKTVTVESAAITLPKSTDTNVRQRQGYALSGWKPATTGTAANTYTNTVNVEDLVSNGNVGANNTIVLNAQWAENKYKLHFISAKAGATGLPADIANVAYASAPINISAANPTNLGYSFKNYTGPNGTQVSTGSTRISNILPANSFPANGATIDITANWDLVTYTFSFTNSQDVDGAVLIDTPSQTASVSTNIEEAATATPAKLYTAEPSLMGYTFGGFTGGNANETYAVNTTLNTATFKELIGNGSATTIVLSGKWTPKTYTITFDPNGGQGTANSTFINNVKYTANITLPTAEQVGFSKVGHVFSGWLKAAGDTNTVNYTKMSDAVKAYGDGTAMVMYAKWVAGDNQLTVVYHWQDPATGDYDSVTTTETIAQVGGSSLTTGDVVDIKAGTVQHGSTTVTDNALKDYYKEKISKKDGREYDAAAYNNHVEKYVYLLDANHGGSSVSTQATLTADKNAKIDVYYNVLLKVEFVNNADGYSQGTKDSIKHVAWNTAVPAALGDMGGSMTLTDEGNKWVSFKAWADSSAEYATTDTPVLQDSLTLHPVWNKNTYTVRYAEKDNETGRVATQLTDVDSNYITTFIVDDFGTNKDQKVAFKQAVANTGYTLSGWDAKNASNNYESVADVSLGDNSTFDKLFPNAASGNANDRVATVYAASTPNIYTLNFAKYADGSGDLGIADKTFSVDDSSLILPAAGDVADSAKMYGFTLRDWRIDNITGSPLVHNAGATLDNTKLRALVQTAAGDASDVAADKNGVRNINLYAGWTAVYSVEVPDNSVATFDLSAPQSDTPVSSEETISVNNGTPLQIKVGAQSAAGTDASSVFGSAVNGVTLGFVGSEFSLDGGDTTFQQVVGAATSDSNHPPLSGNMTMKLNGAAVQAVMNELAAHPDTGITADNVAEVTWTIDLVNVATGGTGGSAPTDNDIWTFDSSTSAAKKVASAQSALANL